MCALGLAACGWALVDAGALHAQEREAFTDPSEVEVVVSETAPQLPWSVSADTGSVNVGPDLGIKLGPDVHGALRGLALAQTATLEAELDDTLGPQPMTEHATAASEEWIDRTHRGVHTLIWRTAMRIDRMFGSRDEAMTYQQQAKGKVAFRQRMLRDWLVLEIRPSVTWPKEELSEPRDTNWGLGIGFEMSFGDNEFQARPATF
jgi:hypothetical protein